MFFAKLKRVERYLKFIVKKVYYSEGILNELVRSSSESGPEKAKVLALAATVDDDDAAVAAAVVICDSLESEPDWGRDFCCSSVGSGPALDRGFKEEDGEIVRLSD